MTNMPKVWTESRPEVIELTEALQMFFRERNADPVIAHQALINMLVTIHLNAGQSPVEANNELAAYFEAVAEHLDDPIKSKELNLWAASWQTKTQ
jgi:hypothetical protein